MYGVKDTAQIARVVVVMILLCTGTDPTYRCVCNQTHAAIAIHAMLADHLHSVLGKHAAQTHHMAAAAILCSGFRARRRPVCQAAREQARIAG